MQINLRRATVLQDAIRQAQAGFRPDGECSISVFSSDPLAEIAARREELLTRLARQRSLLRALYRLRAAVGAANAAVGISARLAEIAGLTEEVAQLDRMPSNMFADSDDVILARIASRRASLERSERYVRDEEFDCDVLTRENVSELKTERMALMLRTRDLRDEVQHLNMVTKITLDTETVELLTAEGLI